MNLEETKENSIKQSTINTELLCRIPAKGIQLTKLRKYMLRSGYDKELVNEGIQRLVELCFSKITVKLEIKTSKSGEEIQTFHWVDDSFRQQFLTGKYYLTKDGKIVDNVNTN